MAWTTPRNWSPGETVTASIMNVHVRDQLNVLANAKGIVFALGSPGGEIATGEQVRLYVPFDCEITSWTLISVTSCSIVLDVWKDTFANVPPTVADTIAGTEKPTLSSAIAAQDTDLDSWTVEVDAGDVLTINVDSATSAEQVTLVLGIKVR